MRQLTEPRYFDLTRQMTEPPLTESTPPRGRIPLTVLFLGIVVGGALDLLLDAPTEWWSLHVVYELGLIAAGLLTTAWLWSGWGRAEQSAGLLRRSLAERQVERDAWRARAERALEGLGRAVDEQFRDWQLTPAERDVALMLLKGYGHKEVAALTGRSERTVRQHAVAVYQKSGLQGRAALAGFFLEDLVVPGSAGPRRADGG
jgi:DNA-binding CsgD family transcriptional regulator